jgi:hypothetical protein
MDYDISQPREGLVVCKVKGDYTHDDALKLIYKMSAIDTRESSAPDHFIDFSEVGQVSLTEEDIREQVQARKMAMIPSHIKTVFCVKDGPIEQHMNTYKDLMNHCQVSIFITRSLEEAAEILGTEPGMLVNSGQ